MPRRIPLSRAAQLVGVKRRVLQKDIQAGKIPTFEGTVELSDLLRLYPDVQIHDNTMLERMEHIMERAVTRKHTAKERTYEPEVLASRLKSLAEELVRARLTAQHYERVLQRVQEWLAQEPVDVPALRRWLAEAMAADTLDDRSEQILVGESFLRTMAANVRILNTDYEFPVEGTCTVLECGLQAGVPLEYGCSNGTCGLCRARVVEGEVRAVRPHDYHLSEAEKAQGYFLTCCYTPVTDIVMEARVAGGPQDIPVQRITTRVKKLQPLAEDVMLLQLRTPRSRRLRFYAGQYVTLIAGEEAVLDLPIASCPCDDMHLEFHVQLRPDEPFVDYLETRLRKGDEVVVEGPKGDFIFDDDSTRPVIMLACDTGFAPIKSLTEHAMAVDRGDEIHLYWVINELQGPYLENQCRAWADAFEGVHYRSLFCDEAERRSGAPATDPETRIEGVLKEILAAHERLEDYDIYVAGNATFVQACEAFFVNLGFPKAQLHSGVLH